MKPILVKDLKAGQQVVETEYGHSVEFTIETDAERVKDKQAGEDGYFAWAMTNNGKRVRLFQDHKITWYGPHLYLKEEAP